MIKDYYKNKVYKINRVRREAILSFIGSKENQLVLDIGCGNGELGKIIKEEKKTIVHGADISDQAIIEAQKGLDLAFKANIENNDWIEEIKDNRYDKIIISEVLEHLFQPEKLLKDIKKISHKDTEIIITVPNILFWKNRLKLFFGKFKYVNSGIMDKGHVHFFSWKSLNKLLSSSGYKTILVKNNTPTRGTKLIGRIFPGLFSYQFLLKVKRKNIVIYTAIFGGKDNLINPKRLSENIDYVCFTDFNFQSDYWNVRKIKPLYKDPVRNARKIKVLPHRLFPDYEYSIWIDGNIKIKGDIEKAVNKYLKENDMAIYDHSCLSSGARSCVYQEAEKLIEMGETGKYKDDAQLIKKQIEKYEAESYPRKNGLISSMIIFRKHNQEQIKKIMEDWWQEIKNHSRRDQLSFNYVCWKNNYQPFYIKEDSRNNDYFLHTAHKIKHYYVEKS
jgi:methionine biosynthesis protein MetW